MKINNVELSDDEKISLDSLVKISNKLDENEFVRLLCDSREINKCEYALLNKNLGNATYQADYNDLRKLNLDDQITVKVNLELNTASSFKYKLDMLRAFALGASMGAAIFVLIIITCGNLGWIK